MNAELRRALELGDESLVAVGRALATTDVWMSDCSVVKRMRSHEKLRLETDFYREHAPFLSARTAALVAVCRKPFPAIRLTRLSGRLVATSHDLQTPRVYRRAGAALRGLHDSNFGDPDPIALDDALEARFEAWLPRFGAVASKALTARVIGWWSGRSPLELNTRTRAHRDYSDRNWLWDDAEAEPLGVIDFEQFRPDHPWTDFTRLWECEFHGRDDLCAAFLDGYGEAQQLLEHPDFRTLALLHSIATVAWATETGDCAYATIGRRALDSLLAGQ